MTQKKQKEALDYEKNLCYCYDCDLTLARNEQTNSLYATLVSQDPFVKDLNQTFPNGTLIHQKIRTYKVKSYVGIVTPKSVGGTILSYEICYKGGNCTSGEIALFGRIFAPNGSKIPINKEVAIII